MNRKILLFLLLSLCLLALPFSAAQAQGPTGVTVRGSAQTELPADEATVVFSVVASSPSLAEARTQAAADAQKLLRALEDSGVPREQLQSRRFQVEPLYGERGNAARPTGYRVVNSIELTTTHLDALGRFVDTALAAGANQVGSLSFRCRQTAAAEQQLLADAVRDARRKAETLATAADRRLGQVLTIHEETSLGGNGLPKLASLRTEAATPLLPPQLTASASVTLTIAWDE